MVPVVLSVEAAGAALSALSPAVRAEPRVNGSIFRINRDTRFSKEKTPYKDHLDFWFWDGTERKQAVTGWFLRVSADSVDVGVGAHAFTPDQLARYRAMLVDPRRGKVLRAVVTDMEKAGFPVEGEHYKRVPTGFAVPADPLAERLLRHNALWVGQNFAQPKAFTSARFVSWCMTRWKQQTPLHEWLRDHVQ